MEILSLEVFGRHIYAGDAQEWLKLCKDKKREWILRYTAQRDEAAITEFINNPKISKDCKCHDCGQNKKANVSSGIPTQNAADTKQNKPAPDGNGNRSIGSKRASGTKGK